MIGDPDSREIIDVAAATVVDTEIEVHVDLARVTHEAFRERTGTVWLPLLVLPPVRDVRGAIRRRSSSSACRPACRPRRSASRSRAGR